MSNLLSRKWCNSVAILLVKFISYVTQLFRKATSLHSSTLHNSCYPFHPFIKGIPKNNQGSTKMYRGVRFIHKGHLLPAGTFSFSKDHLRSTFTFTNAVPQYAAFNSGQWAKYERRIRTYATNTCRVKDGTLYLLTGISEVRIQIRDGQPVATVPPGPIKRISNSPNIVIPNSLWTAGCCVRADGEVLGSFSMIGNNVQNTKLIHMAQLTVAVLEKFLHVGLDGTGGKVIHLFPGNRECSKEGNNVHV